MQRGLTGLKLLFWGSLVDRVCGLALSLYFDHVVQTLSTTSGSHDQLFERMRLLNLIGLLTGCGANTIIALGLAQLARAWPAEARVRGPARLAFVVIIGLLVDELGMGLVSMGTSSRGMSLWKANMFVHLALALTFTVAVWLTLRRVLLTVRGRAPDWLGAIFLASAIYLIAGPLLRVLLLEKALPGGQAMRVVGVIVDTAVLAAIHHVGRVLRTSGAGGLPYAVAEGFDGSPGDGKATPALSGPGWDQALVGLEGYRGAVIANLVLLLVAAAGMVTAVVMRSPDLVKTLAVAVPAVNFIISVFIVSGLVGYAAIPELSGARLTAQLGVASVLLNLLVQIYMAFLLYTLFGGSGDAWEARRHAERTLPMAQLATQVLSLGGILMLLSSFRALAGWLERADVVARTGAVTIAAVLTMVGLVVLQLSGTGARSSSIAPFILGGVVLLALAIFCLVGYLSILRELTSELRTRLGPAR